MLELFLTKTFVKDFNKIKFSAEQHIKYIKYLTILLQNQNLPKEAKEHSLKGEWLNYKEFHLGGDLLIIYKIDNDTLELIRIGTHSQLFKKF